MDRESVVEGAPEGSRRVPKRPYAAPSLVVYGDVGTLTGGNGGPLLDGGSGNSKP